MASPARDIANGEGVHPVRVPAPMLFWMPMSGRSMLAVEAATGDPELFRPYVGKACRSVVNGFGKACADKDCVQSTSVLTG